VPERVKAERLETPALAMIRLNMEERPRSVSVNGETYYLTRIPFECAKWAVGSLHDVGRQVFPHRDE